MPQQMQLNEDGEGYQASVVSCQIHIKNYNPINTQKQADVQPKNKKQPNFKINLNVLAVTRLISFDAYLKARVL
jgi:hypothetical protein